MEAAKPQAASTRELGPRLSALRAVAAQTERAGGRRERNKAEKRSRILAAATRLLAEHGYDRMTMAQVAREAEVGIGTVFQYAATKPELLMMVTADRWAATLPGVLASAAPSDADAADGGEVAVARILALLDPLRATAIAEPEVAMAIARELLFGAPGEHRDRVVGLVEELEGAVGQVLREAGASGAEAVEAAARLVVSGALLEVNRSRTGRATVETMTQRLSALVTLVVAGAIATR